MTAPAKRPLFRWIRDAKRLSWLLALFLVLSQSFVLFDTPVDIGNRADSCSLTIAALPSSPSDCTLSKPDGNPVVPALLRSVLLAERPLFSANCTLFSSRTSAVPYGASPLLLKTASHLRV